VTITNPLEGQNVSGTVICTADSNCDSVKWYIDDVFKAEDTSAPFTYTWDTTQYPDGDHTVKAEGYIGGVYQCEDSVTVTVGIPPPYVTITNPSEGEEVKETYTCTADSNCESVKWYIDGVFKAEDTSAPFTYTWDTTQYSNGDHTVKAEGYNGGVYKCEDSVTVTVYNPPQSWVEITNPPDGATVKGRVTITVDASSDIDTVEFYIDGARKSRNRRAPFSYRWDTRRYSDGTHTITVKGYSGGEFKAEDTITVNVANHSIALLSFLVLFLPIGIYYRRR